MKKLLIWGTGMAAMAFKTEYESKYAGYFDIMGYVDQKAEKQNRFFCKKKIYSPTEILGMKWDMILLCTVVQKYQDEMMNFLLCNGIDRRNIATFMNYNGFGILRNILIEKYGDYQDEEIKSMVQYIRDHEPGVYNVDLSRKEEKYKVYCDGEEEDPYIILNGKRLYYPREWLNISDRPFLSDVYIEQSANSPHLYMPENRKMKRDAVIVDAGAREGNFSIQYIEECKKIYIVECEKIWCRALEKTFRPYGDKVRIVHTFLGEKVSMNTGTIDSFINEPIDFLKMDIEGAECKALLGAKKCLEKSNAFCSICSYHNRADEKKIKDILSGYGYATDTSNGYMLYLWDENFYRELDVRRGIVYAEK